MLKNITFISRVEQYMSLVRYPGQHSTQLSYFQASMNYFLFQKHKKRKTQGNQYHVGDYM